MPPSPALGRLLAEWEVMSEHHLPGRRQLVRVAVEELRRRAGGRGSTVVELGSGPGSLLRHLATAIPDATLVGIEVDPVLICLHAAASAAHAARPIGVVTFDLSESAWTSVAPAASVDAVVAVQVLHYFAEDRLGALLGEVRTLLRTDGVFVHLDHVPSDAPPEPTELEVPVDPGTSTLDGDPDPWTGWWSRARELPILTEAFRDRDQRSAQRAVSSAEFHPDERTWRAMLRRAGLKVVDSAREGDTLLTCASPGC